MGLDKKTIRLVEKKASEMIRKLRAASEKEFDKLLKQSEKATDADRRKIYFNKALGIARRTEQMVSEIETQMAAIKSPWHAAAAKKKRKT